MDHLSVEELALQRKRYAHLSDEQWRFMLQQVEGRQRTRDKLPTFATIDDWWYPVRLSCEQCSSEITARYKSQLFAGHRITTLIDLTGGYGVDTFFMSETLDEAHYIERNEELCHIAQHNFSATRPQIQIHNTTAEEFLSSITTSPESTAIFIDPARRSKSGGKVFLLEDCEPNIISLLPTLLTKAQTILIKLSPMLDITAALRSLNTPFDVHIVALQNEVKEVLLFTYQHPYHTVTTPLPLKRDTDTHIYATNLIPASNHIEYQQQTFTFTLAEEQQAICSTYSSLDAHLLQQDTYIYEPNAAIIKSGAFKLIAERYHLIKMAPSTHLYLSNQIIADFPGRTWQIIEHNPKDFKDIRASIMTRNYPLTPEQLRKKLKIKDCNTHTIIGARLADKPTLFLCKKI